MINPERKALELVDKHGKEGAEIQAIQCLYLSPIGDGYYWEDVIKKIKNHG